MANYETDFYDPKPMPRFKKPNSKFPKDEMDEQLDQIEQGSVKPDNLSKARKALKGQPLARPRFGGFGVGR